MKRIYMDHIAGTPLYPEVVEAMLPFLHGGFGNPQSFHREGRSASEALETARAETAVLIGAEPGEILFTASGSESNNTAVKGIATANRSRGTHLVTSAIEHSSVLNAVKSLEKQGFSVTQVPVDRTGRVDPAAVGAAITPETALVSVMLANSEVGTIQPIAEIAALCREQGVPMHTDAVPAVGNLPLDVKNLGVDALSLAASQFGGPRGAAALYLRRGVRLAPLIDGGIQEGGRRAGSENLPGIVGLGKAAELARSGMMERVSRMSALRDRLIKNLPARIEHVVLTGHPEKRLPYHASFCIEFVEGEAMLLSLDMKGFAISSGSACTSRSLKASHVLLAMGYDHSLAQASLVFSLVEETEPEDIEYLLDVFPPIIQRLREMSPLYNEYLEGKSK